MRGVLEALAEYLRSRGGFDLEEAWTPRGHRVFVGCGWRIHTITVRSTPDTTRDRLGRRVGSSVSRCSSGSPAV
jgi:hypothetical protein